MATCPNGHEVHAGSLTCPICDSEPNVVCPNGHPNTPGNLFCETCGVPLPEAEAADDVESEEPAAEVKCPNGHPNTPGNLFCETCGVPMPEVADATHAVDVTDVTEPDGVPEDEDTASAAPLLNPETDEVAPAAAVTCPNGHPNTPGNVFCETCGEPLAEGEASDATVVTEPIPAAGTEESPTAAQPGAAYGPAATAPPFTPYMVSVAPGATGESNGLAIASLVLGILWLGGLGALLALIFGYVSKRNIDQSQGRQSGRGMAIAGIVLGWVGIVGAIAWIIFLVTLNHAVDNAITNSELTTPSGSSGNSGAFTTTPPTDSPNLVSAPAGGTVQTWTIQAKGPGGYTEQVQVLLGHAEHARDGKANGQDVAGQACSFNSETDALVPVVINASNTTASFSALIGINIGLNGYSDDSDNGVSFEGAYTSGTQCNSGESFGVSSTTSDSPGAETTLDGFFVISNYYTPAAPDGDPSLLGATQLTIDSQQTIETSDDSLSKNYTVTSVTGPGVQDEDDEWILNLGGMSAPSGQSGNTGYLGNTGDNN
jgi:hypothetical protein